MQRLRRFPVAEVSYVRPKMLVKSSAQLIS